MSETPTRIEPGMILKGRDWWERWHVRDVIQTRAGRNVFLVQPSSSPYRDPAMRWERECDIIDGLISGDWRIAA
jgi:hypothetical protein